MLSSLASMILQADNELVYDGFACDLTADKQMDSDSIAVK